jgi:hypothetical protein
MIWLLKYFKFCLAAVLAVLVCNSALAAGMMEYLSEGAYSANGGGACAPVNEEQALKKLNCDPGRPKIIFMDPYSMNKVLDASNLDAERKYFKLLAQEQVDQLTCAQNFAGLIAGGSRSKINQTLAERVRELRHAKQDLIKVTQDLNQNKNITQKVCPLSMPDLAADYAEKGPFYQACEAIIKARAAYGAIYNSIPLSNVPSVKDTLEKYANDTNEELDKKVPVDEWLQMAYVEAANEVRKERYKLEQRILKKADFDRTEKAAFLSEPGSVARVLERFAGDPDVEAIACRANARYGEGAQALDSYLLAGSLGLSFGAGATAKAIALANSARVTSGISIFALRSLQAAAIGANVTSNVNFIGKSCLSSKPTKYIIKKEPGATFDRAKQCSENFSAESVEQDSCLLDISLAALGYRSMKASVKSFSEPISGVVARNPTRVEVIEPIGEKVSGGQFRHNLFKQDYYDSKAVYIGVANSPTDGSHHYYLVAGKKRYDGFPLSKSRVRKMKTQAALPEGVVFKVNVDDDTLKKVSAAIDKQSKNYNLSCLHGLCRVLNASDIEIPGAVNGLNVKLKPVLTGLIEGDVKVAGQAIDKDKVKLIATSQRELEHFLGEAETAEKAGRNYVVVTTAGFAGPLVGIPGAMGYVVYEIIKEDRGGR